MSKQLRLPTLLIVVQNPASRAWIKTHLDADFFLIFAENDREAIDALSAKLDLIIVDSHLEGIDPLALCKQISLRTQKNLIPLFLITGRLKKSYREKAQKSGVIGFLNNQLDAEELKSRIEQAQKAASAREKITDYRSSIKVPKLPLSGGSLKDKIVLNDAGLKLLAAAKKEEKPVCLMLLQIDHFNKLDHPSEIMSKLIASLSPFCSDKRVLIPSTQGRLIFLLSDIETSHAHQAAENLKKKIEQHIFPRQNVSVSIVLSSLEPSEKGFNKMIDTAIKSFKARADTNLIISLDDFL